MSTVHAYGAHGASDPVVPMTIERRELGPKDVLIDIKFCGICHSDIHFTRGEWGEVPYPRSRATRSPASSPTSASEVSAFTGGDRVGVGCMVNSCGECENCLKGERAVLHPRQHPDLRLGRSRRDDHQRRLLDARRRRRGLRPAGAGRDRARRAPRRCCAPASPPTRRCATGRPGRASRSPSSASAGSGTWP